MEVFISFLLSVGAGVIANYISNRLNRKNTDGNQPEA